MQFSLASVLGKLILYDSYHREIVRLNRYRFVLDLYDQVCPCEARFEEVGEDLCTAIADNIGHVGYTIGYPLQAI